jgi:nucleotide-binding universal stress UspA family protein
MTILCATDFSPCSATAIRLATSLARRNGEGMLLLDVVEPLPVDLNTPIIPSGEWESEMMVAAQSQIERQASEIRKRGVAVETRVVFGPVAQNILDAALALGTSLIVIGTRGLKGAARLFLGSCAAEVVRAAHCPVLVTREDGVDLERWDASTPLRLEVATDESRASEAVFFWVRTAAPKIPCDVSLVRVYWPPQEAARYGFEEPWLGNEGHPDLLKLIERDLRRDAKALSGAHEPNVRLRVAVRNAGEELAEDVAGLGVDALVIGIPKHHFGRWTSITPSSVLRSASFPVFCIPEGTQPKDHHIPRFRSVLIASDLSLLAKEAILPAYGLLAGGGRAELCYIHERGRQDGIGDPFYSQEPTLSEDERVAFESKLRAQVPPEGAEHGIATRISILEGQPVAAAILQAAERLDVEVIALASHGRTGLGHLLLGSVAEEVAKKSSRPVLIVHAKLAAF